MSADNKLDVDYATFRDGSGKGSEVLAFQLKQLADEESRINALRAFIEKHKDVLAGCSWSASTFGTEIGLGTAAYKYYRGEHVGAEGLAAIFPQVSWRREKHKWASSGDSGDSRRDWVAELDGVTLRIECAEGGRVERVRGLPTGVVVKRARRGS
jgi:hypothetical protein